MATRGLSGSSIGPPLKVAAAKNGSSSAFELRAAGRSRSCSASCANRASPALQLAVPLRGALCVASWYSCATAAMVVVASLRTTSSGRLLRAFSSRASIQPVRDPLRFRAACDSGAVPLTFDLPGRDQEFGDLRPQQRVLARPVLASASSISSCLPYMRQRCAW